MGTKTSMAIYNTHDFNLIIGFYSGIGSFILSFLQYDKFFYYFDLRLIILGIINGFFNFYANHFTNESYRLAPFNKISFIVYFIIIIQLFLGFVIFREQLALFDLIGGLIIIGYNYISAVYFS
jgi:drug/metabolite transporter (DMT)-like permease